MASSEVSGDPDLSATLEAILSSTRLLVPYDVAEITLWDEVSQSFVTACWGGDQACATRAGGVSRADEGSTGWIARHRQALLIPDVKARHDVRPKWHTSESPFGTYIGVPLQSRGHLVGTLELGRRQSDAFSERDLDLVQAAANHAAIAIENVRLFAETQLREEQQSRLARIALLATSRTDLDGMLDLVMAETIPLLKAETGVLLLYDEEQDALVARCLASAGLDRGRLPAFRIPRSTDGFDHSLFARGGSYFSNDPEDDPNVIPAFRRYVRELGVRNFAGAALMYKDRSIGELYLGNRRGGFGRGEVWLVETVARFLASAVENSRLYDETRRRASELVALATTSAAVGESLDLDQVLRSIASAVRDVVGCQVSAIFVSDEGQEALRLAVAEGKQSEPRAESHLRMMERRGQRQIVASGEPVIIADAQPEEDVTARVLISAGNGFRASADLPLTRAGRVLGLISALFVEPHRFSNTEVELLTVFASQAAIAIENAGLYTQADSELRQREEALRRHNRELATLYQAATVTSADLSLDAVLRAVSDQMTRAVGAKGCILSLWDRQRHLLCKVVDYNAVWPEETDLADAVYDLDDYPALRRVLDTGRPVLVRHGGPMAGELKLAWMEVQGVGTLLMLPLIGRGQVLGLVELVDEWRSREYTPGEIRLAQGLAAQAVSAIENARLYEEAQQEIAERRRAAKALRRLHRVSREINATLDQDRILGLVLEEAIHAAGATHGNVVLKGTDEEGFRLQASLGYGDQDTQRLEETLIRRQRDIVAEVLEIGGPVLVADARLLGRPITALPEACSALTVPIFFETRIAGLINLYSLEPHAFDDETVGFVQALADQAAIAVGNAQRYEEQLARGDLLHRRADQLAMVLGVSRALRSDRPLEEILEEIAYAIQESVGFNQVLISVLEGDPLCLRRVAAAGVPIAVFERMKEVRQPWSVISDVMSEEFRVGQSYYVPVERQGIWRARLDKYAAGASEKPVGATREPGRWDPRDILLVPLAGSGGDVQGVLSVDQPRDGRVPGRSTTQVLEIFAGQAALAVENSHLVESLRLRADTLALFNDVNRLVTAQLDLGQVLNTVVAVVPRTLLCDYSSIFLLDRETGRYVPRAAHGSRLEGVSSVTFAPGEGLVGAVAESGMPLSAEDLQDDPRVVPGSMGEDMRSAVLAPLTVGSQVVGILCAGRRRPPEFSPAEVTSLSALADQVAVAVQNARLFDEVRSFSHELEQRIEERTQALAQALAQLTEERDRVETLYRITSQLSVSLDLDRVLNRALDLVVEAVGADRAAILMQDAESGRLVCRAALGAETPLPSGDVGARQPAGEGLADWVIGRRSSVIAVDIRRDPRWLELQGEDWGYGSALGVPLLVGDEVLGALLLLHTQPDYFRVDHLRLVETAAIQVANAISNAELYGLIRDQARQLGDSLKAQQIEAAKSQAILEGVADGVVVADADGKIILVNAAAQRILQLPRNEAPGRTINEMLGLYGDQTREWLKTAAHSTANARTHTAGEFLAAQLRIGARVVSVHLARVLMGDEFLGTVSVFRDVTAEVEAERAKTEFVSMVSHELRTPMTSIKGYADLMLAGVAGTFTERQRDFLTIIKSNADRLTALVNDLLNISRIESGRMVLAPRATSVEDVVNQVIKAMGARLAEEGSTLKSEVPPALPPVVVDPDRMVQILTNLVANACQYTPAGGEVVVSASVHGDEVHILVRDTGIGIPQEDQDKVFSRFFRVDTPMVQESPGTGLGLSIVRALVEMGGGRVWVESELGEGSTFTFTLPVAGSDDRRELGEGMDVSRRTIGRVR